MLCYWFVRHVVWLKIRRTFLYHFDNKFIRLRFIEALLIMIIISNLKLNSHRISSIHCLTPLLLSVTSVSLIVLCLYMNLIILVLCSAFNQILILFVLPLFSPLHVIILYFNKKSHSSRSFIYTAPYLRNYLPNNVRTATNYICLLDKNLKNYLFNQTFPT